MDVSHKLGARRRRALPLENHAPTRPVHLLAVGSGDCLVTYRWELDRYPRVKGCIIFLQHVANIATVLQELDLLVMPSLWEACPILPMEAMVSGTPLVRTDCIGLREILHGSSSVMIPKNDPSALAAALREAIKHPGKEGARAYSPVARQRFDVRPIAKPLSDLFASLTCGSGKC